MSFQRLFPSFPLPHFGHGIPTGRKLIAPGLWHTETGNNVYQLNFYDFSVIKQGVGAAIKYGHGAGGKEDVLWYCGGILTYDVLAELSVIDFSVVKQVTDFYGAPYAEGTGGTSAVLWVALSTGVINEQSVVDFSIIRSNAPAPRCEACGGDESVIWGTSYVDDVLGELSVADLSWVRYVSYIDSYGVGGATDIIYLSDLVNDIICEVSTVDLSIIRSGSSPTGSPKGVGGWRPE